MQNHRGKGKELESDFLYIGDGFDNTVKTFNPETGRFLGRFVPSGDQGLNGPRGLIFNRRDNLLVSNQNVDQPPAPSENGDVLKYNGQTAQFLGKLVERNPNGPFAPQGIVLSKNNVLFVADRGNFDFDTGVEIQGIVKMYDGRTGTFLGDLDHSGFSPFHPRGLVIGPDGLLYVTTLDFKNLNRGWVLRFDTKTKKLLDVFISHNNIAELRRPAGLVFGPDGNLYVTSYREDEFDTDKILIVNHRTRKLIDKIDLYAVGQPRAFPETILFGPEGKLFVPIAGPVDPDTGAPDGEFTGSVRRYNVKSKNFVEIVPPFKDNGPLGVPLYLTFVNTDPATLTFDYDQEESSNHHHYEESSDESS